jgi:hypothetical protein
MIFLKIPDKDIGTKDTVGWQKAIRHMVKVLFNSFFSHVDKDIVKEVLFILIYHLKGQSVMVSDRAISFFDEFL